MKILPINSYQNNANFKGSVDKSVYRYLNEVRHDALNQPLGFFGNATGSKITAESFNEVKAMIEGIMSKLNNFMAKTHSKTNFFLSELSVSRNIGVENKELEICIYDWPKDSIENGEILIKAPTLMHRNPKYTHRFNDLRNFEKFVTEFTEKIKPEEIDGALFDKKVKEVIKRAEETAPKNRLENRTAFNRLDRLAPKFHREPIYTEQFKIIQSLAIKLQEERAKDPTEQSKEALKNLKID